MATKSIENVLSEVEKLYSVPLTRERGKKIIYSGRNARGEFIIVCTPESKMHVKGHGWTDITMVQKSLLEKGDHSILALRMDDNKEYYLDFKSLEPYLIPEAILTNKKEGDHWKLYIWPDSIEIRGNTKRLPIRVNGIENII